MVHETYVGNGNTSIPSDPSTAVVEESRAVIPDSEFGDLSRAVGVQEINRGDLDFLTTNVVLKEK